MNPKTPAMNTLVVELSLDELSAVTGGITLAEALDFANQCTDHGGTFSFNQEGFGRGLFCSTSGGSGSDDWAPGE